MNTPLLLDSMFKSFSMWGLGLEGGAELLALQPPPRPKKISRCPLAAVRRRRLARRAGVRGRRH